MRHTILSSDYEARFVDTEVYPPSTPFMLRGLAAALQDAAASWEPVVSELAAILRPATARDDLVACGASYGAAKSIQPIYPGPSLLLYGAIVNRLYQQEDIELNQAIDRAEAAFQSSGLADNCDVARVLDAARERSRMGRVSEAMRTGFTEGMQLSGRYTPERAADLARRIVTSTHDVRHRAIIDKMAWMDIHPVGGNYFIDPQMVEQVGDTDPFQEAPPSPGIRAGSSLFAELVPHAQVGCAFLIARQLLALRANGSDV
jgi:hypothetical protein